MGVINSNIDKDKIITEHGWDTYVGSIQAELKRITGSDVVAKKHHDTDIITFRGSYSMFSISKNEFTKNNERGRKQIAVIRWMDFIWGINDEINEQIDFIQKFDPGYNPRDHRD